MTRIAARSNAIRLMRRSGAAIGGLLLGLAAAADPAAASCASPVTTISRPGGSYSCYRDCTVAGGSARQLSRRTFAGERELYKINETCTNECNATPGCTSVSFYDWYRDGVHYASCTFWTRSGTETTAERPIGGAGGNDWWVCHRNPPSGLWRDPRLQPPDTDRFQQDQFRPSAPLPRGK